MFREVYWAKGMELHDTLVALSDTQTEGVMMFHVFEKQLHDTNQWENTKNLLFDNWKKGQAEISLPQADKKIEWKVIKSVQFPSQAPKPEDSERMTSIENKVLIHVLKKNSHVFKEELLTLFLGYQAKVEKQAKWTSEDEVFVKLQNDLLGSSLDLYRAAEAEKRIESEVLSPADRHQLVELLREIEARLKQLKAQMYTYNYEVWFPKIEALVSEVSEMTDMRAAKDLLIEAKSELREVELARNQKDDLYLRLNKKLDEISDSIQQERKQFLEISAQQYAHFAQIIEGFKAKVAETTQFHDVREEMKEVSQQLREARMEKEKRSELLDTFSILFNTLSSRQTAEKAAFEEVSAHNYEDLSERMVTAKKLASFGDDYKEVREFLKSLQTDIFESKLTREQKDTLKTQINEAFLTIKTREEKYYNEKRKLYEMRQQEADKLRVKKREEWVFRMKEKIIYLEKSIASAQKQKEKELDFLESLKEADGSAHNEAKIARINDKIQELEGRIQQFSLEIAEIEQKLSE